MPVQTAKIREEGEKRRKKKKDLPLSPPSLFSGRHRRRRSTACAPPVRGVAGEGNKKGEKKEKGEDVPPSQLASIMWSSSAGFWGDRTGREGKKEGGGKKKKKKKKKERDRFLPSGLRL